MQTRVKYTSEYKKRPMDSMGRADSPLRIRIHQCPGTVLQNGNCIRNLHCAVFGCICTAKPDVGLNRRLSGGSKGQTGLLHSFYTPIAVCLVVCAAVWCVFLQMNSSLSHRTDDINDWLNDPTVIEQYNEAAEKQQRNDNLVQGLQQVRNLTDALATYPQVDSALMSKIGAAGGAQVSMVLTGYDAATGALQFDAQSGSVIDIPSYVLKLQKTGLFRKVDYTGYTYEELQALAADRPAIRELLALTDLLIDGRFKQEERDLSLLFRGSRNQRVIDMNLTRENGKLTLAEKYL